MKRFAVYTTVVGSYDDVRQPLVVDDRFDYILFSNDTCVDKAGVWEVRHIPFEDSNGMILSRYGKCHPTELLHEYEASLYLDANVQIAAPSVYGRFMELVDSGVEWAGINHPDQHCIYDEICAILDLRWVHDYDVVEWYAELKRSGFPEDWGLYENNVIFRRHSDKVARIDNAWWKSLLNGCKRDQFSLMYFIWRENPVKAFFLPEDECPRLGSDSFKYFQHNPHKRRVELGFSEKIRSGCMRVAAPDVRVGYHELFDKLSTYRHPLLMLYLWQCYAMTVYGPKVLVRSLGYHLFNKI